MNILQVKKYYHFLGKAVQKQINAIKDQGEI